MSETLYAHPEGGEAQAAAPSRRNNQLADRAPRPARRRQAPAPPPPANGPTGIAGRFRFERVLESTVARAIRIFRWPWDSALEVSSYGHVIPVNTRIRPPLTSAVLWIEITGGAPSDADVGAIAARINVALALPRWARSTVAFDGVPVLRHRVAACLEDAA